MTEARARIDVVLAPGYLDGLGQWSLDDVRGAHEECIEIENEVSYSRRLAQARLEILAAERERRDTGGSVADLVAALPRILADPGPRPAPAASRLPRTLAPSALAEVGERESLITDDTLANLPTLSDEELESTTEALRAFEREVSERRRSLHGVMDRIDAELAQRMAG